MKTIIKRTVTAIAILLALSFTVDAQINLKKLGNTVKRSAEQQVEQKIKEKAARETRQALDRGEEKLDQSISNATSKQATTSNNNNNSSSNLQICIQNVNYITLSYALMFRQLSKFTKVIYRQFLSNRKRRINLS